MAGTKTVLVVLALASAAALAMSGGDGDEKLPDLPPPPDDDEPPEPVDPDSPTVPIPTPTPNLPGVKDGAGLELDNVHQLEQAADFAKWGVLEAVEPDGLPGPASSVVVVGYDVGWIGRPAMLDKVGHLAATNPDVQFVLFDFATSRRLIGEPSNPVGYVITAVAPDGRGRVFAMVGRKKTLGPLPDGRWTELVRYATEGAGAQQEELRRFDNQSYHYVVLARPRNGQWEWKVWRDVLGEDGDAVTGGRQATKALAFEAAQVYVMGLGTAVVGGS